MVLVVFGAAAIVLLVVAIIMVWGAFANLIHAGKLVWHYLAHTLQS